MPRSYRLLCAALGGCLILAAFMAAGYSLYKWYNERDQTYESSRQQYEASKSDLPPGVATSDGKRSIPDPKSYREEWRSERYLEAQREMSDWTFLMIIVTGASVAVTALGVVYVARTLHATRDAVELNRQMTDAANRQADAAILLEAARLKINRAYIAHPNRPGGRNVDIPENGMGVRVGISNIGKTPALVTEKVVLWTLGEGPPVARYPLHAVQPVWPNAVIHQDQTFTLTDDERPISISEENREAILGSRTILWAYGYIKYEDWFGIERVERFVFRWKHAPEPNETQPARLGFVPHKDGQYYVLNGD